MATARRWTTMGWMAAAILVPLTVLGIYVANPFGVQSYDPRQRIVGYGVYRIPSASMLPTLKPGAIVFSNAGYYRHHEPMRGDIVVFAPPQRPDQDWVKRVIGMPGDRIGYHHNIVSINGKPLSYARIGPYRTNDGNPEVSSFELQEDLAGRPHRVLEHEAGSLEDQAEGDWVVPPDHYFLMGDNRDRSDDSRFWGPVPRGALRGRLAGSL